MGTLAKISAEIIENKLEEQLKNVIEAVRFLRERLIQNLVLIFRQAVGKAHGRIKNYKYENI